MSKYDPRKTVRIIFILCGILAATMLTVGAADGVRLRNKMKTPAEIQLAICRHDKPFTTAEGIIAAPYGKKHRGVPDDLWVLGYVDKDGKLVTNDQDGVH